MEANQENKSNQDQEDLIQNHIQDKFTAHIGASGRYFATQLSVILLYLIGVACNFTPTLQLTLVSLMDLIEFWLCKNVDGLHLVGMRWSHEIGNGGDPQWIFYSRQDPYVPEPMDSNVFWIVLFGSCFFWFCIFFWAIFEFTPMNILISFLVFASHLCNCCCFMKCHFVSTKQADDVARSVLLDSSFDNQSANGKEKTVKAGQNNRTEDNVDTTNIHLDIKLESDSEDENQT